MSFKQQYLHELGPYPFDFQAERVQTLSKIMKLVMTTPRNLWSATGFNLSSLLESYKQLYGFEGIELESIICLLTNILFSKENISIEVQICILKILNRFSAFRIKLSKNLHIDNSYLLTLYENLPLQAPKLPLKICDSYLEELTKFVITYSKFGQETIEASTKLAIKKLNLKYLAIFIGSVKELSTAQNIIKLMFVESSLWEKDNCWFYIISQLVKKFPKVNLTEHYTTILQEIIVIFMTIMQPFSEIDVKRLTTDDQFSNMRSILKSVAVVLVSMILPNQPRYPQWKLIWSSIERIFNLIISTLDHVNEPPYSQEFLQFLKSFMKLYLARYRKERKLYLVGNEDKLGDSHGELGPSDEIYLDETIENNFDQLWKELIPKLLYFQDNEYRPSKILSDLVMYKPQLFAEEILQHIASFIDRNDLNIVSLVPCKITILFLLEYVIQQKPQYTAKLLFCLKQLVGAIDKLGLSENLDILELLNRTFYYWSNETIQSSAEVQSLVEDIIQITLDNLETISISLNSSDNQQCEIYVDFANIYFTFFMRVDQQQFEHFEERFTYKLLSKISEHFEVYELLCIAMSFRNKEFGPKLMKHIYKQLISDSHQTNTKQRQFHFLKKVQQHLVTHSQNHIKWYCSILQCCYQYHPENIIKDWQKIEKVIILLLLEWNNTNFMDIALDVIFNIVLSLEHVHHDWQEFNRKENGTYTSIKVGWQHPSKEAKELIGYIYQNYYIGLMDYIRTKYTPILNKNPDLADLTSNDSISVATSDPSHPISLRKSTLKLVDYLITPNPPMSTLITSKITEQKNILLKIVSIQYTILSALLIRVPCTTETGSCDGMFWPQYQNLRKEACAYLNEFVAVLCHYDALCDPAILKTFNYFWREAHDETFFTAILNTTSEKLQAYFTGQTYKKKDIMQCPSLILQEVYYLYTMRMQLKMELQSCALANDPDNYLDQVFIYALNPTIDSNIHSYIPMDINIHDQHRRMLALCRYKLDPNIPGSYVHNYLNTSQKFKKTKYQNAIIMLLTNIVKKNNLTMYECCLKDDYTWDCLISFLDLFRILEKKKERIGILELYFLTLIFAFERNFVLEGKTYDVCHDYAVFEDQSHKQNQGEIVSQPFAKLVDQKMKLSQFFSKEELIELNSKKNHQKSNGVSKSSSLRCSPQLKSNIQKLIKKIIAKTQKINIDKDFAVYILLVIMLLDYLDLETEILRQVLQFLIKYSLCDIMEIFNISKVGLFHLINRYNWHQKQTEEIENSPIKRPFTQYLIMRNLGGPKSALIDPAFYDDIDCDKADNYFYKSETLTKSSYSTLSAQQPVQKILLQFFNSNKNLTQFFKQCAQDKQLKNYEAGELDLSMFEEQNNRSLLAGSHKLTNYVMDENPKKIDPFSSFYDNYAGFSYSFYSRFIKKVCRLGNEQTLKNLENISQEFRKSTQIEDIKISLYIALQLLPYLICRPNEQDFLNQTLTYIAECTNEIFDFICTCLLLIFNRNFVIAQKLYQSIIVRLRKEKGTSRFRHLQVMNVYMLIQGRFARNSAVEGISYLLKGIDQGSDDVSAAIVTMLVSCFIITINYEILPEWVQESTTTLIKENKLLKLNENVAYEIDNHLREILQQIISKTKHEADLESNNLKIYSKIASKILSNITVTKFNNSFYDLLKDLMFYVVEKIPQKGQTDEEVILQLCDSEYPDDIYQEIVRKLLSNIGENSLSVTKKKLTYLQGIATNRSFCKNRVEIPDILSVSEKQVTLEFIITVSNIARIMLPEELTETVETLLSREKKDINWLMAYILAAGVKEYAWKEQALKEIVKMKKLRVVKEFISFWWKGKNPETDQQKKLHLFVRSVENPYNYFA